METPKYKTVKEYMKCYFFPYALLFVVLQFCIFITFYLNSKTFIWYYDGASQHYPAISYYSDFLKKLFSGQSVPMIDLSIGLGFDTITSLSYYVIGDPLTLFSFFANPNSMELVYSMLVLLRFFLAGLTFSLFCFYKKKAAFPTTLGSLIYVFSNFALYAGLRHPFFLNPLIYLPLLLIGIDRLLTKKKGLFFSVIVAISALSNFYFLYMLSIVIFIYALVTYFFISHNDDPTSSVSLIKRIKLFLSVFLRSCSYYLLGIGLSGVLLFPTIYAFLHNGRIATEGNNQSLLHYGCQFYRSLPQILFSYGEGTFYWTIIGISVIASLCTVIALFGTKRISTQKVFFLLCVLFLTVPFFGNIMNGFSSPTNRWCFVITLLLSYFVATYYNDLFTSNRIVINIMLGCILCYVFYAVFFGNLNALAPTLLLIAMMTWILLCTRKPHLLKQKNTIMLVLVCSNLVISSNLFLGDFGGNYSKEFLTYGEITQSISSPAQDYLPELGSEFYRIQDNVVKSPNSSLTTHQYGSSYYLSLMNEYVFQSMLELSNSSLRFASQFLGFDKRTFLLSLNGVKYYITRDPNEVPFGYRLNQHVTEDNNNFYVYENDYALPLGYTYDTYLTYDSYLMLSPLEKQEALMQCIILESPPKSFLQGNPKYSITKVDATVSYDNIIYDNHQLTVQEPKGKFILSYKAPQNSELYLSIDDLNLTPSGLNKISISTKTDKAHHNFTTLRAASDTYYFGMNGRLLNLGYQEKSSKKTQLILNQAGTFTLGSLSLYALSMDNFSNYYKDRIRNSLTDVTISTNKISGHISSDHNEMLLLTIPYSTGWSATLDGECVPTYRANTMYTGIDLTPGEHTLVLSYQTPYLNIGIITSLLSLFVFLLLLLYHRLSPSYIHFGHEKKR